MFWNYSQKFGSLCTISKFRPNSKFVSISSDRSPLRDYPHNDIRIWASLPSIGDRIFSTNTIPLCPKFDEERQNSISIWPTERMVADIMTEALGPQKYDEFRNALLNSHKVICFCASRGVCNERPARFVIVYTGSIPITCCKLLIWFWRSVN